jgi:hypothetical protein
MDNETQDALRVKAILKTPAWRVVEDLMDSALVLQQEQALQAEGPSTEKYYEARGAWKFVNKFKAALRAAASVSEENNDTTDFGS